MVECLQPKGREFESTCVLVFFYLYSIGLSSFLTDVPRPPSNDLWIILFQKVDAQRVNEPVCLEHQRASNYSSIRNKTPEFPIFLEPYFSIL